MLSAGLTSQFSIKKVRKLNRICHTIFQAFTGFVILTTCWSSVDASLLCLLRYKQQSLAYSNMCYLLWSHVEYRIVFIIIIIVVLGPMPDHLNLDVRECCSLFFGNSVNEIPHKYVISGLCST